MSHRCIIQQIKYYQRRMLKRCTWQKLLIIVVIFSLIYSSESYNSFWKCKDSLLLGSKRFQFIKQSIKSSRPDLYNIIDKFQKDGLWNHNTFLTDMKSLDSSSALGRCKNFIMSGQSCCQKDSFQLFVKTMRAAIEYLWSLQFYPIVDFAKDFQNFVTYYKCFPWWRTISHDEFWAYYQKYKPTFQALMNQQIKFFTETACLMCMGPKDFSTFVYPNPDPSSPSNILIFNKQYFKDKVDTYTNHLMKLESFNQNLIQLIFYYAEPIPNQSCVPQNIPKFKDRLSMYKYQNCNSWESCKKVAAANIGEAAAPYFLFYIKSPEYAWRSEGTDIYLSQDPNYGFRGDVTYSSTYTNQYLPDVTIIKKGDRFTIDITPIK